MEPEIPLILDVVLPALGAGAVAVLATVAVERLGGVAGGIFSSVPTTIVPAAARRTTRPSCTQCASCRWASS
jgi:hypothetical protein